MSVSVYIENVSSLALYCKGALGCLHLMVYLIWYHYYNQEVENDIYKAICSSEQEVCGADLIKI